MAPHSSTLAWKIPWTEEPGGPQSMGSLRVGQDSATLLSLFTFMHWRRQWQPTPVFLPGESQGRGASWAAAYGVTQSRTRLKRLSSSRLKPAKSLPISPTRHTQEIAFRIIIALSDHLFILPSTGEVCFYISEVSINFVSFQRLVLC